NLFFKPRDEDGAFGSRPDEAHIAANDVDELRQLVNAQLAYEATDARDARIILTRPDRAVLFGVGAHRAKLDHPENVVVQSEALLCVENRPARIELDGYCR